MFDAAKEGLDFIQGKRRSDTIAVTTVAESVLEELTADDVLHKRSLAG